MKWVEGSPPCGPGQGVTTEISAGVINFINACTVSRVLRHQVWGEIVLMIFMLLISLTVLTSYNSQVLFDKQFSAN